MSSEANIAELMPRVEIETMMITDISAERGVQNDI